MTKRKVLLISLAVSVLLIIVSYFGNVKVCSVINAEHYSCMDFFYLVEMILLPFWFITIFSLITYSLREETFRSWLHFAKWWVPLSMLLVLITPDGQGGGYMPSLIDKQVVAFFTSAIFTLISLIIVIYKSIRKSYTG